MILIQIGDVKYPGISFTDILISIPHETREDTYPVRLIELGEMTIGSDDEEKPYAYVGETDITVQMTDSVLFDDILDLLNSTQDNIRLHYRTSLAPSIWRTAFLDKSSIAPDVLNNTVTMTYLEDTATLAGNISVNLTENMLLDVIATPLMSMENIVPQDVKTQLQFKTNTGIYENIFDIKMYTPIVHDPNYNDMQVKNYGEVVNALLNNILSYAVIDLKGRMLIMPQYYDGVQPVHAINKDEILDDYIDYGSQPAVKGFEIKLAGREYGYITWKYLTLDYGNVSRDGDGSITNSNDVETVIIPLLVGNTLDYFPAKHYFDLIADGGGNWCSNYAWSINAGKPNLMSTRIAYNNTWSVQNSLLGLWLLLIAPQKMRVRRKPQLTVHGIHDWQFDRFYKLPADRRIYRLLGVTYNFRENTSELSLIECQPYI